MGHYFPSKGKPRLWGSFSDRQYAIKKNLEKIYKINPGNMSLCLPLFWGLPILDYSGEANRGINQGAQYKFRDFYYFITNNAMR